MSATAARRLLALGSVLAVALALAAWFVRAPETAPERGTLRSEVRAEPDRPVAPAPRRPVRAEPAARQDAGHERRLPEGWPEGIHPDWVENHSARWQVQNLLKRGPFPDQAVAPYPFLEVIDEPRLTPAGFGPFMDEALDACAIKRPSFLDCSEAPCVAIVWWTEEEAHADIPKRSSAAFLTCPELYEPFGAPMISGVGELWVDCPTGRRFVTWVIPGHAYALTTDTELHHRADSWRQQIRMLGRPPDFYCALP